MTDDPVWRRMVWHPYSAMIGDVEAFWISYCDRTNALDLIGSGCWVRLNSGSGEAFALVVEERADGSVWRSWCEMDCALVYIARILRAAESERDAVLSGMSKLLDPLTVMRFAAMTEEDA